MRTRLSRAGETICGRPMLVGAAACGAAIWLGSPRPALAQVDATLNGAPIQVQPYVPEPGVPNFTVPTGTLNPPPTTGTGGTGPGGGGNLTGSEPLTTMLGMPWGISAVDAVQSLGINPSAIAATCVLETGCQNSTGVTYTGVFQMGSAAFQEGLATALAANPLLASQIVPGDAGRNDPLTAAIATAGYQIQAVSTLQSAGTASPTVLDTRGYFNFGPSYAVPVAQAPDTSLMSDILPASYLSPNGIKTGETVGQWRASVISKIGSAASQAVLS